MKRVNLKNLSILTAASIIAFCCFSFAGNVSAEEIDSETCMGCHDDVLHTLQMTSHNPGIKGGVNCVDCHINADAHIEDPSPENIETLKNLTSLKANKICAPCHQPHRDFDAYGYDPHQTSDVSCTSCHNIHGGKQKLLLDNNAAFCTTCHMDTKADFMKRSNHPVKQNILNCLSCHKFAKQADNNMAYGVTQACQSCHPQQSGPHMYEHEAALSYSVEGGGCMECHEPHGSVNDKMLKQDTNQLCKSCHMVPGHELAHPLRNFNKLNCMECHSQIHGSFTSNLFLDENLPSKFADNCYQSGCHSLNK